MADDDEIDILGDFENYLSRSSAYSSSSLVSHNTDILGCNYTIHPQWLLDKPSANPESWYDSSGEASGAEASESHNLALEVDTSIHSPITDQSGWTKNEKNLLERGIEIFNNNEINLSQFIGSKTPSEVRFYLDNFYTGSKAYNTYNGDILVSTDEDNVVSEVLADVEIPASIEVIADDNDGSNANCYKGEDSQDLDKNGDTYYNDHESTKQIFENVTVKKSDTQIIPKKHTKLKLQTPMKTLRSPKRTHQPMKQKAKMRKEAKQKLNMNLREITTGIGLSVPVCKGEEIVKITKEVSEDDSDVDLEIIVEDAEEQIVKERHVEKDSKFTQCKKNHGLDHHDSSEIDDDSFKEHRSDCENPIPDIDLTTLISVTVKQLMCLEEPKEEYLVNQDVISEIEKVFNPDFFISHSVKRSSKNPERYTKIRNFILNMWNSNKPLYVTKTSLRQGLRNCGDVNCIGRIHSFLEQIGAINFGCDQVSYIRPLYKLLKSFLKEKNMKETKIEELSIKQLGPRQRFKKKFINDGEGGCTIAHDEKGDVINTIVVDEKPVVRKTYTKKPVINLISCRSFTREMPQKYRVILKLSALIPMDFHAHTSLSEVMGFIAGSWNPITKTVTILKYEPCQNIASSSTHCEMCPISQAKAADNIHDQGLEVLGWFHSHPTFAPEPSQQDIETQLSLQYSIGSDKPCIGVILSPFSESYSSSQMRCLVIEKKINFEDQTLPYKLKVDLNSDGFKIEESMNDIWKIYCSSLQNSNGSSLNFNKNFPPESSSTLLHKFIENLKIHLSKFTDLNEKTSAEIVSTIYNMLKQ